MSRQFLYKQHDESPEQHCGAAGSQICPANHERAVPGLRCGLESLEQERLHLSSACAGDCLQDQLPSDCLCSEIGPTSDVNFCEQSQHCS